MHKYLVIALAISLSAIISGCTVVEFANPFVKEENAVNASDLLGVWKLDKCLKGGKEDKAKEDAFTYAMLFPAKDNKFWISIYSEKMKHDTCRAYCGELSSKNWMMINTQNVNDRNFSVNAIVTYELKKDTLTIVCPDNKIFEDAVKNGVLSGEDVDSPEERIIKITDSPEKLLAFYLEHIKADNDTSIVLIFKKSELNWKQIKENAKKH